MKLSRCAVFGCALLVTAIGWQPASGHIVMPAGSTVWMEFKGSAGPNSNDDDIAASNQAGVAPPNGIPLITATEGESSVTGYAEILPDRVRTFMRGATSSGFMHASFQDTYTVGGTAAGPFDITVRLHITGTVRSIPFPPFGHAILVGSVQAEIGTFYPDPLISGVPLNEQFRVTPFGPASDAVASFPTETSGIPFERPVDITATYTKTGVNVGDVFNIAYGVNSAFSRGEIDLLDTGAISFDLPEGVTLSSSLAQSIPEPAGCVLLALCLPLLARRRAHSRSSPPPGADHVTRVWREG